MRRLLSVSLRALALVLALVSSRPARAEINLTESLELLVAQSDWILTGRISKLAPVDAAARGKSAGLSLFLLEPSETIKRPGREAARAAVCVGVRDVDPALLETYQKQRTELILFLSQSVQATTFEKTVCDLWPLREQGTSLPYLVPVSSPGNRLLSASTFKVLKDRASIVAACSAVLKRLPATDKRGALPKPVWLEVPFDSEVHQVLYSGSACYLYVPDGLFPQARQPPR